MALQKSKIIQVQGRDIAFSADYWKIVIMLLDSQEKITEIVIGLYENKETADISSNIALKKESLRLTGQAAIDVINSVDVRAEAYVKLKLDPRFAGATDI